MEVYRIIKKSRNRRLTITIPESLNDKQLEIIVSPVEQQAKRNNFNPEEYQGIWKNLNFNAEVMSQEMRKEWERNI